MLLSTHSKLETSNNTHTTPMNSLKKLLAPMIGATALLTATSLTANQVATVGGYGPYQAGSGGEFTLKLIGGGPLGTTTGAWTGTQWTGTGAGSVFDLYSPLTRNKDTAAGDINNFETFCVEGAEFIYANTTFDVTIGQTTIFSGTTLTQGAAWLYGRFATGVLSGYNYTGTTAQRKASASLLQNTIWALMGQEGMTQFNTASDPFTQMVIAQFGGWSNALIANGSTYGVAVLNLWAVGGAGTQEGKRQDQLILTSDTGFALVPDGGWSITLLGISLFGMAALRRKFLPAV